MVDPALISQFMDLTNQSRENAVKALNNSNGSLETALDRWFTHQSLGTAPSGAGDGGNSLSLIPHPTENKTVTSSESKSDFMLTDPGGNGPRSQPGDYANDPDLMKAIEASIKDSNAGGRGRANSPAPPSMSHDNSIDPDNNRDMATVPIGLRNVGNTCYVNSLLQVYYSLVPFREHVMRFRSDGSSSSRQPEPPKRGSMGDEIVPSTSLDAMEVMSSPQSPKRRRGDDGEVADSNTVSSSNAMDTGEGTSDQKATKPEGSSTAPPHRRRTITEEEKKRSVILMKKLQKLFVWMKGSMRKFIDPTFVLDSLVDDTGKPVSIGDQQDALEFNDLLMNRIEEAEEREGNESPNIEHPVHQLFYGTSEAITQSKTSQKGEEEKGIIEEFLQLQLTLQNNPVDLYDCLDSFTEESLVEDYMDEDGNAMYREVWFNTLPPIFTLQLVRATYSAETKGVEKIHDALKFPKTLYLDRYCRKLRTEMRELRKQKAVFKAKVQILEKTVAWYNSYTVPQNDQSEDVNNCKIPIVEALQASSSYLTALSEQEMLSALPSDSTAMQLDDQGKNQAREMAKALEEHATHARKFLERTEVEIKALRQQMTNLFAHLRSEPYELHAVLVHGGQAGSGHYWAYIRQWLPGCDADGLPFYKWFEYNDINVKEVPEDEVFRYSEGGLHRASSAYCFVYVKRNVVLNALVQDPDTLAPTTSAVDASANKEDVIHIDATPRDLNSSHYLRQSVIQMDGIRVDEAILRELEEDNRKVVAAKNEKQEQITALNRYKNAQLRKNAGIDAQQESDFVDFCTRVWNRLPSEITGQSTAQREVMGWQLELVDPACCSVAHYALFMEADGDDYRQILPPIEQNPQLLGLKTMAYFVAWEGEAHAFAKNLNQASEERIRILNEIIEDSGLDMKFERAEGDMRDAVSGYYKRYVAYRKVVAVMLRGYKAVDGSNLEQAVGCAYLAVRQANDAKKVPKTSTVLRALLLNLCIQAFVSYCQELLIDVMNVQSITAKERIVTQLMAVHDMSKWCVEYFRRVDDLPSEESTFADVIVNKIQDCLEKEEHNLDEPQLVRLVTYLAEGEASEGQSHLLMGMETEMRSKYGASADPRTDLVKPLRSIVTASGISVMNSVVLQPAMKDVDGAATASGAESEDKEGAASGGQEEQSTEDPPPYIAAHP
eukprot:Clim_evm57s218 gene=Clim_evmTU57s218